MPAVPAIIMGGAALGSSLIGKKASDNAANAASKRSPEELALMKSQTGLANQQAEQGSSLFRTAMPGIQSTLKYYQTLANGGRAARMGAVANEAEDVAGAYTGADNALLRSNLRGGERDAQLAENSRAKAGQVARLVTGVRPQASNALLGGSMGLLDAAGGNQRSAGGMFGTLLGNSTGNRLQGNAIGSQTGSALTGQLGKLFANIMDQSKGSSWWGKGGSGGGGGDGFAGREMG